MPPSTRGKYEVCLQTNTGPETFQASPDDFVGTAFEFEGGIKHIRYVPIANNVFDDILSCLFYGIFNYFVLYNCSIETPLGKYEVCLQTNTGPETFQASPDDFVGTAFEFEKNINYVDFIITLNERKNTKNNDTCVPTESNAFDVLMVKYLHKI
jgi:hypothetical protein